MCITNISNEAAFKRINRALLTRQPYHSLRKARAGAVREAFGAYFVQDWSRNLVLDRDVDLEDFARSLGVLEAHERVAP